MIIQDEDANQYNNHLRRFPQLPPIQPPIDLNRAPDHKLNQQMKKKKKIALNVNYQKMIYLKKLKNLFMKQEIKINFIKYYLQLMRHIIN